MRNLALFALAWSVATAVACGDLGTPDISSVRDAGATRDKAAVSAEPPDASTPQGWGVMFPDAGSFEVVSNDKVVVYAHSGSDLFSVDPEKLEFTRVGPFVLRENGKDRFLGDVTDIAIDRDGRIVGTTFSGLLEIDGTTAVCTRIASLPPGHSFNGLSWIRAGQGNERLLATTLDGTVYEIDPKTGAATPVGPLGMGLMSSGDLVSVESYGTLVTLTGPGTDRLARIDPATGVATIIGDTGFKKIWGLGFWKNRVFGFTQTGQFILIDPTTGAGTLVTTTSAYPFWGAGVTTSVPVIF